MGVCVEIRGIKGLVLSFHINMKNNSYLEYINYSYKSRRKEGNKNAWVRVNSLKSS